MEQDQISVERFSFTYPLSDSPSLNDISFTVQSGEFILLCGESGCGKTTLLKHLKKELAPHGEKTGTIKINGRAIETLSTEQSVQQTGFVMQSPENQLVTDKVWHELAFGLENLGIPRSQIRVRTAEMASYFGIGRLFNAETAFLSGGQKQMLNLASVTVTRPDILLLDEPTSQLDPIAAEGFLHTLSKMNRELGITVIMTEQRLEECFSYADRVLVLEKGQLIFNGSPQELGKKLLKMPAFLRDAVPTPLRVYAKTGALEPPPITVKQGREWLKGKSPVNAVTPFSAVAEREKAIELKDICFRYHKKGENILNNCSLSVPKNSFFAILGENGAGKSTLLKIIGSVLTPLYGTVRLNGKKADKAKTKTALLPQETAALFTEKTVFDQLNKCLPDESRIREIMQKTDLTRLSARHPFDLSGGEQQKLALAGALLLNPDILLLDEPTKGMDAAFKKDFAALIKDYIKNGGTAVMISHDIEFCAYYTDFCAMLFDGEIAAVSQTREFFLNNRFYTTAAHRMSAGIITGALTDEDILKCVQKN